ncbi:MAG: SufS family cysteine desulfurase [Candidatus Kapabacteria bacterium]|nr:SufS family cysteine desulfurase [Candidatus Kapabacteria bacterium]
MGVTATFDIAAIRAEFPILSRRVHDGRPLVYMDSAATTMKPRHVLDAMRSFDEQHYSNVHRGSHTLAAEATEMFEGARTQVAAMLGANADEIIFTKGTTESVNLVAATWGRQHVQTEDVILVSAMEHHANIVPWQMVAAETGASVRPIPVLEDGSLDDASARQMLTADIRILAVTHVSNVLGTVNNVARLCAMARERGIVTFVDGAQAVQHGNVNVRDIGCDFYAFSAHKLYGPTGVGVLYGRREMLASMPPYQGGGAMIDRVSFAGTTYAEPPMRFEAGTPHLEGAIGLAAAIEWFRSIDCDALRHHEAELLAHATEELSRIDGMRIIGTSPNKVGIISFVVDGVHASDIGMIADRMGVAMRVGHHCAQPLMDRFGVSSTVRMSFGVHTSHDDVQQSVHAVAKAVEMLR